MTSCLWLERPAAWRPLTLAILFALVTGPVWPLAWHAVAASSAAELRTPFWTAMGNSLEIAVVVAVSALAIGLPAGLVSALYEFPGRRLLLTSVTLPLLAPSF